MTTNSINSSSGYFVNFGRGSAKTTSDYRELYNFVKRRYDYSFFDATVLSKEKETYEVLFSAIESKTLYCSRSADFTYRNILLEDDEMDKYEIGERVTIDGSRYRVHGQGYEIRRYPNGEIKRVNKIFE